MNSGILLRTLGCALGVFCFSAQAATLSVTYQYTLSSILVDPANPPFIGTGSGSLLPLGNMAWSDRAFPDGTGTFVMTFANGTLFGNFLSFVDFSAPPYALPLTQTLNVTGGTGAFVWYNGTLTGSGVLNTIALTESVSGSGTINTTPEPGSVALVTLGLLCLVAHRIRWGRQTELRKAAPMGS